MDRMADQLRWCAGAQANNFSQMEGGLSEINPNMQDNLNFNDINKAGMNNFMQNRLGRSQGRNLQGLHGMEGSMKVSETRDSSYQGISAMQNSGIGQSLLFP